MKFRTMFDKHDRVSTGSGDRYKAALQLKIHPDGSHEFMNIGKDDIYLEIQSHADSCDIHWILDHFVNNPTGLSERLKERDGQFLDALDFPKTYAEMLQRCIDARNFFYSLEPDIRSKFNHSVDEFIAQMGSDRWNDIMYANMVKEDAAPAEAAASVEGGEVKNE